MLRAMQVPPVQDDPMLNRAAKTIQTFAINPLIDARQELTCGYCLDFVAQIPGRSGVTKRRIPDSSPPWAQEISEASWQRLLPRLVTARFRVRGLAAFQQRTPMGLLSG